MGSLIWLETGRFSWSWYLWKCIWIFYRNWTGWVAGSRLNRSNKSARFGFQNYAWVQSPSRLRRYSSVYYSNPVASPRLNPRSSVSSSRLCIYRFEKKHWWKLTVCKLMEEERYVHHLPRWTRPAFFCLSLVNQRVNACIGRAFHNRSLLSVVNLYLQDSDWTGIYPGFAVTGIDSTSPESIMELEEAVTDLYQFLCQCKNTKGVSSRPAPTWVTKCSLRVESKITSPWKQSQILPLLSSPSLLMGLKSSSAALSFRVTESTCMV